MNEKPGEPHGPSGPPQGPGPYRSRIRKVFCDCVRPRRRDRPSPYGRFLTGGYEAGALGRQFDPNLGMADIIQACRNAWTACGLQPLLGVRMGMTPSVLGYSLLYPYSDNYLDREDISAEEKLRFSERFRSRLRGDGVPAQDYREAALWTLVKLIEEQYARASHPQVFDCLLAIHRAQEESLTQQRTCNHPDGLLRVSCAKGGTSVLADACLAHGWLSGEESHSPLNGVCCFNWETICRMWVRICAWFAALFFRAALAGKSTGLPRDPASEL